MPNVGRLASRVGNRNNYGKIVLSGLILKYDMQNSACYNGSGTNVTDILGNSNATLVNTPTFNDTGIKYLAFNGTNSYLKTITNLNPKLSPANTSTVISIFVWVYMTDNGVIVSEQGTSTPDSAWYDSQIERVGGTLRFSVWPYTIGTSKITSSIATNLNTWYYVGFTYDGSTLRAYVNGSLAGTSTYARQTPYNSNTLGLFYTLGYGTATSQGDATYSAARVGAFHIYNSALSVNDILYNYNNTRSIYNV